MMNEFSHRSADDSIKSMDKGNIARILIAEDDMAYAVMLREAFEINGYSVDIVISENEAFKTFNESRYDIAVIDHSFDGNKGGRLFAEFRNTNPECVFILLTCEHTPDPSLLLIRQGAADCLRKPFDPDYLVEKCFRALKERELLRVHDLLRARTLELQASENNLKAIFETFDDLYYQTDLKGIVTMISPSLDRLSGWNQDEIIGKPVTMVYDDPDARKTLLKAMAEKGYLRDYEISLKKKTGRRPGFPSRLILSMIQMERLQVWQVPSGIFLTANRLRPP